MNELSPVTFKGISFVPTYQCPAFCSHCNVPSSPEPMPVLKTSLAKKALEEAKSLGFKSFTFSGGEPLLKPEMVLEILAYASQIGLRCHRFATTGYIANNLSEFERFLKELQKTGHKKGMRLSVDRYHSAIPLETIAEFICLYSLYFPVSSLTIGCCDKDTEQSWQILGRLAFLLKKKGRNANLNPIKKLLIVNDEVIKLGFWAPTRPTRVLLSDSEFNFSEVQPFGCLGHRGLGYLLLEPSGNIRVCCGNAGCLSKQLIAGNLLEDSLTSIVNRAKENPLYKILAEKGPLGLVLNIQEDKLYTHRCELCYNILTELS